MIDLAIVTSCHNYGKYLNDWAQSVVALTTKPKRVAIIDNGSTDATWAQVQAAAKMLEDTGLEVHVKRTPLTDFGTARNEAVSLGGDAEWIMHMDTDDMFMPHCLDEVKARMPNADVIPLGYERVGDLASGPRNRTKLYKSSRGKSTLTSTAPASGVSPFRRSLWEQTPYRTDMIGGWDTAMWIGFAHLNARFVPSKRTCFKYRQHGDSIFNQRRKHNRRGRIVGTKLRNLRKQLNGVSVIVPRRGDNGSDRDKAWAWLKAHYETVHPDWAVLEDGCDAGPWRKGVAVDRAMQGAKGDVLVIADSDCILPKEALEHAVELVATKQAPWVIPHTLVKRLDKKATGALLCMPYNAEPPYEGSLTRAPYVGFPGGGFIIVDHSAFQAAGGMPKSFAGWGAEDEATATIMDTLVGPHVRLEYDLWHMWHVHAKKANMTHHAMNRSLLHMFRAFAGDQDGMFELVERLQSGLPIEEAITFDFSNSVQMVSIMDFKRGRQLIKRGERFIATEDEAKRHESRPRKMAMRVSSPGASQIIGGADLTLEIRSRQYLRNEVVRKLKEANL